MLELNMAKAKELVEQAIQQNGVDYVYEQPDRYAGCLYVHGVTEAWDEEAQDYVKSEGPLSCGCIVGKALNLGGVSLETMLKWNDSGSYDMLAKLESIGEVKATPAAADYLARLQNNQDNKAPWGLANEKALKGHHLTPEYDPNTGARTGKFKELTPDPLWSSVSDVR